MLYVSLEGLFHLKKNKYSHNDIKPENILVVDESKLDIKICDFGLVRL